jgi:hypothetical protein
MYFVVPEDVPELTGKKGIVPGQVQFVKRGKSLFQYSSQNCSYVRSGTRR